ncbi:MAG: hypothetical protein ABSA02_22315 [Trebonia sp.]
MRHSLRPRLTAIAPSTAEAVRCAGGWLFDQVLAGWDVTVVAVEMGDTRPLEILGVRARQLDVIYEVPILGPCLQSIAVRTDLFHADEQVRRFVLAAAGAGGTEVRLWGDVWPEDFDGRADPVSHRLSLAARAFKAQAMAAADLSGEPTADTEVFRRGELRRPRLVPATLQNA